MRLRSGDLRPNTFLNCQDPKGQIADIVLTSKKLFREFSAIFGDPIYGQGCLSHLWPGMFVQARSQTVESLRGQGKELALAHTIRIEMASQASEGCGSERRHAGGVTA